MKKKYSYPLVALALLLLSLAVLMRTSFADWQTAFNLKSESDLIANVMSMVKTSFVEPVDNSKLVSGALTGMLKTLDPYSLYMDKVAYEEFKRDQGGEFGGIGLEVSIKGGPLHVLTPLDGSPAAMAGLKPGDMILKIDDTPTKDMSMMEAVRKMRGKPGSHVKLTIMREGDSKLLEFDIERQNVKVEGVRDVQLLEGRIGYIRIAEFQRTTSADFKKALQSLMAQDMKALIIDVRNDPGGLLHSALQVTENFLPEKQLMLVTKGRDPQKNRSYYSSRKKAGSIVWGGQPIAILINRGSASGSEILAGALQDYGLAKLVGTRSYGKGCIQTLTPLSGGGAVRITTSRYYTPNGRLIHEIGLEPDTIVTENKNGEDEPLKKALDILRS